MVCIGIVTCHAWSQQQKEANCPHDILDFLFVQLCIVFDGFLDEQLSTGGLKMMLIKVWQWNLNDD